MSQQFHIPLESVRVGRPCRAEWDAMEGDDRVRFCQSCHKNVYNLSALTREQAEALINQTEGERCIRYYQRSDGSVMTSNCSVGIASATKPFAWVGLGAILLAVSGVAAFRKPAGAVESIPQPLDNTPMVDKMRDWPIVGSLVEKVSPRPVAMAGLMVITPPSPPSQAQSQ